MTIYEALMKDHDELMINFSDLLALDEDSEDRHRLLDEIRDGLIPHSRAEESIFYNSIRALSKEKGEVMHGFSEHMAAEALFRALQLEIKTGMGWKGTAEKLKDALEHHIAEEEGEVFRIAESIFTEEEARMMGEAFEKMKPEIKEGGFLKNAVEMASNLMPPRMKGSVQEYLQKQTGGQSSSR